MVLNIPNLSKVKLLNFIGQLFVGMLGAAMLFILFHLIEPSKPVVTADVTGIINRFIKSEISAKLPAEQKQKQVQLFGTLLENTLHNFANNKQVILLPKEAVIAGAKDVTGQIEGRLKAQLPPISRNF